MYYKELLTITSFKKLRRKL